MNILIVDDEYYIVQNMLNEIDWEKLGITRTFTAYGALQAKKILSEEQIDIMVTDIEMPLTNGLELIEWANENHRVTISLILTGHQSFAYAQQAVHLHCFGYLLKPLNIGLMEQELQSAVEAVGVNPKEIPKVSSDFLTQVKECVKRNLANPELNRAMIANEVHVSQDYLSYLFHKKSGQSLSTYMTWERLQKAQDLLAYTDLPMQEICDSTGFASTSYFHRIFRKVIGMTPQQYRNIHSIL